MQPSKIVALVLVALVLFGGPKPVPNSSDEVFLYRAVDKVAPGLFPLNQGAYGSCVAAGHAGAVNVLGAIDKVNGKAGSFVPASIDAIYGGSRNEAYQRTSNSYSQGSSGYGAVTWLNKYGGVIYAKPYPEYGYDLTKYSIPNTRDWGATGNGGRKDGINGAFDKEAAKHPVKGIAKVLTLADLDAALVRGCPVTICSGQGFASPRDKDGFCAPAGRWSHCMCIIGKRNEGRKGYLILNSWGPYIKGDGPNPTVKNKYKDQPDGSFYAEPEVVARILRSGDCWALSELEGFPKKLLPDWLLQPNAVTPAYEPEPVLEPTKPVFNPASVLQPQGANCVNGKCYAPTTNSYRRGLFR